MAELTRPQPPEGWFRQLAQGKARDEIVPALVAAGLHSGEHHRGSGWSDEGGLEYEPPKHGWVIVAVHGFEAAEREEPNSPAWYWWAVDHAGKGRRKALMDYAMALTAAGLPVVFGHRRHQQKFLIIIDRPVSRADGRWER